jgi:hypothetical protein
MADETSYSRLPVLEEGLFLALRLRVAPGSPQFLDRMAGEPAVHASPCGEAKLLKARPLHAWAVTDNRAPALPTKKGGAEAPP